MKTLLITCALSIALCSSEATAQTSRNTPRNGRFWDMLDKNTKVVYLVGVMDGLEMAVQQTIYNSLPADERPIRDHDKAMAFLGKLITLPGEMQAHFFGRLSVAEVGKGVDQFFRDPANALVPIKFALEYFQAQASGSDMKEWESKLQGERQMAAQ